MANPFDNDRYQYQSKNSSFKNIAWLFAGVAVGAVSIYFMDPDRGRRRRAILRDQAFARGRDLKEGFNRTSVDLRNRVYGKFQEMKSMRQQNVDDQTLVDRVRSAFGREIRHPKSIHTSAQNGIVTLSGLILTEEVDKLLRCVWKVRGVKNVINQLDIRTSADGTPGLQGSGPEYLQ